MMHVFWAFASFLTIGGQPVAGSSTSRYITADDLTAKQNAKDAVAMACGAEFKGSIDKESGRSSLENGVGADNIFYKAVSQSSKVEDIPGRFEELATPSWLFWKVMPLAMVPILILSWLVCCCASCPCSCCMRHCRWCSCCKCCGCCKRYRHTNVVLQVVVGVGLVGLLIGYIACMAVSMIGFTNASNGVENIICSSAKLVDTTLDGSTDPSTRFIGLIPVFDAFGDVVDTLNPGSSFLNDVDALINATENLTKSLTLATGTISLLSTSLTDATTASEANLHTCTFCAATSALVAPVSSQLSTGVATALEDTRTEIRSQLFGAKRQEIQDAVSDALKPLAEVKNSITDSLKSLVDEEQYKEIQDIISGPPPSVQFSILIIFMLATLLLCYGCCLEAAFLGMAKSDKRERNGLNPHNKEVPCCACCSWMCLFFFAILAFFIGGFIVLITVPLSGACLILDDLNSASISDIANVANIDLSGATGSAIKDIVDKCFVDTSSNNNLLELIKVEGGGGQTQSIMDLVVTQSTSQISTAFDQISSSLDSAPSAGLLTSSVLRDLTASLSSASLAQTIVADSNKLKNDPSYSAIDSDSRTQVGLATTLSCSSFDAGGVSVPGIASGSPNFLQGLIQLGTANSSNVTCAQGVICNNSAGTLASCEAGNNLMVLKENLLTELIFNCPLFVDDSNTNCDPGTGANCLRADGTVQTRSLPCDIQTYATYIGDFPNRLNTVIQQLDAEVVDGLNKINNQTRAIVEKHLLTPIEEVANGVTCGFFGTFYREVVESLCYQGVFGIRRIGWSYVSTGILTIIFIVLMFSMWRRLSDNHNLWEEEGKRLGDSNTASQAI